MEWTDERVAALIRIWGKGKSASKTALEMNDMFGLNLTRSAIIGKVHRLIDAGLMLVRDKDAPLKKTAQKPRSSNYKRQKKQIEATHFPLGKPGSTKPTLPANVSPTNYGENVVMFPQRAVLGAGPVTLDQVRGCMYAVSVNSRSQHMFCNAEKREGSAYCEEHHKKCHLPTKPIGFGKVKKWRAF